MKTPPPIIAPYQLPFVRTRYGVEYCGKCDLALTYCVCGTTEAETADVSTASPLARRIAEARGRAGGR